MIGRTLSTYRIVEKLGAGGMGEVYLAVDERLGRDVALKILPEGRLRDDGARARFRKEAQALLRLSHPHVATLFDFGAADGIDYLVMERVVGPTLDVELRKGALAETQVVRLGAQLARGLAAAHEAGVVHRDLKPSNLALTPDGLLKVLDFGLARVAREEDGGEDTTATATAPGAFVGTPAYMAPEQVRGDSADARTDVYGAGAVLYELATGQRLFAGRKGAELSSAILSQAPSPPRAIVSSVSAGLEAVVLKALDKDPDLRYQSARELLVDLERLQQGSPPVRSTTATSRRRAWSWIWAAAVIPAAVLFAWHAVPAPAPRITAVRPLVSDLGRMGTLDVEGESWATDGERVYYVAPKLESGANAGSALYQVAVAGGDPAELPCPFPHGLAVLGYVSAESALLVRGQAEPLSSRSEVDVGLPLWLVPVPFGPPRRVPNLLAWDAGVAPDGRTLAVLRRDRPGAEAPTRLLLAGIDGTTLRDLGVLPVLGAHRLCWSPDGRRLRFTSGGLGSDGWESQVWEIAAEGGPPRALWPGAGGAWTVDGRYFLFERTVREAPRSDVFVERESRWPPWGRVGPEPLTVGPLSFWLARPGRDPRHLIAYGRTGRGELMRFDPSTRTFAPALDGESALYVEPSPDGQWLAWVRYPEGTLWKGRPDGSGRQRLTSAPLEVHLPRWSPDGTRLAFAGRSPSEPQLAIHVIEADGSRSNVVARPARGEDHYWDPCWLPDETIVFGQPFQNNPGGLLHVDPRTGGAKPMPGGEELRWPKCSRQGDLLATFVDASGQHSRVRRRGQASWEDLGVISLMYPNWTRDGRSFCGRHFPSERIECFSLDSRRLSTLGPKPPFQLLWWVGSAWMGLDAEDRPLVAADRSTIGLYALDWEEP